MNATKQRFGENDLEQVFSDASRIVVIRYRARNALRQFGSDDDPEFGAHDQLYWNAVGHGWQMPIQAARTTVHLPDSLADVPDDKQRELCERLKYDSIAQIARDMQIPRTTLNAWIRKLRQRFESLGLKDYLTSPSSIR